jgi:hypothetical protein
VSSPTTTTEELGFEHHEENGHALSIGDAVVPLLRGVVYSGTNARAWQVLQRMESAVRDYVSALNLDLFVDRPEGFAYLRRKEGVDEDAPTLLRRRPLSYRVSLMIALLRRRLAELDGQGEQTRLVLNRDELVELVRTYHPDRTNETKLYDAVDADANKLVEMGFCRRLRGQSDQLEVLRIVKAFVDAQWLSDFDERLSGYLASIEPEARAPQPSGDD